MDALWSSEMLQRCYTSPVLSSPLLWCVDFLARNGAPHLTSPLSYFSATANKCRCRLATAFNKTSLPMEMSVGMAGLGAALLLCHAPSTCATFIAEGGLQAITGEPLLMCMPVISLTISLYVCNSLACLCVCEWIHALHCLSHTRKLQVASQTWQSRPALQTPHSDGITLRFRSTWVRDTSVVLLSSMPYGLCMYDAQRSSTCSTHPPTWYAWLPVCARPSSLRQDRWAVRCAEWLLLFVEKRCNRVCVWVWVCKCLNVCPCA